MSQNTRDNDQLRKVEADKGEAKNNPQPPVEDVNSAPAELPKHDKQKEGEQQ